VEECGKSGGPAVERTESAAAAATSATLARSVARGAAREAARMKKWLEWQARRCKGWFSLQGWSFARLLEDGRERTGCRTRA
jgi:hypothetical protein